MNAKVLLAAALFAAGGTIQAQSQPRVAVEELPGAVQRALSESSRGEPIKAINRRVVDGRTVYDVELERNNALNPRFRITEDGIVVAGLAHPAAEETAGPVTSYDGISVPTIGLDPMIPLDELPGAVRDVIKQEAAGRPIADIDRETWQGRTVYEVEFDAPGRNPQIHIAEDGTMIRPEQKRGTELGTKLRNLFVGTQLEDTPSAVQATIRREARGRELNDIDVERRSGERVYEVEINDGQGTFQIHIAENGRLLHDTRSTSAPPKRG